ncbi:MAG: helix-turn-helix transcriptional regulator [Lachnospiraceae bacterium]|nr:helix-turn-helix transcriptional regulator [Lachnospiraceae bacterium]
MIQKDFGWACKKLRESKGLSQEKFALLIEMDRTYYASVESGKRNISIQNIKKIADGFGISVSQLFKTMEREAKNID